MADIELVIKINEKYLKDIKDCVNNGVIDYGPWASIANGTPLPKGHGRLIDADAFERRCMFDSDIEDMQDVIYALRDFKPVMDADKEGE